MLKGAPPMLVVGAVFRVALFAAQLFAYWLGDRELAMGTRSLAFAGEVTSAMLIAAGAVELAVRTRGRQRAGCVVAAIGALANIVVRTAITVLVARMRDADHIEVDYLLIETLQRWGEPLALMTTVAGLAVAAGLRSIGAAFGAFACVAMVAPIPPLLRMLSSLYDSTAGIIGYCTLYLALSVFVIRLGAVIARGAEVPTRDHERAVRGTRVLLAAVVVRATFAVMLVAIAAYGGVHSTAEGLADIAAANRTLAVIADVIDVLGFAALVRGTWLMARAQHPALATGMVGIALACAMCSLVALANVLQTAASISLDYAASTVPPWWLDLGGTLALGWLVVTAGRLARRAPAIKLPVVIGGALFTIAACVGIATHRNHLVSAACAIVANLALVPVLRAMGKAIAEDPIKSTADVFA